jgi:hypothetical protein
MSRSFVVVYSWRVSSRAEFAEQWKRAKMERILEDWSYRFSVEQGAGEFGAVFALHTRWSNESAWEAALVAAGTNCSDGAAPLTDALKKLVIEVFAVESLHLLSRPRFDNHQEQPKQFSIRILEARGLLPKNANGLSDPYVVTKMGLQRKQQTTVKSQTLEPRWNESFVFAFGGEQRSRPLKISVRSKDFFFTTHEIGRCNIDLRFYRDYSEPVWVPLLDTHGKKSKERGEVLVQIVLATDPVAKPRGTAAAPAVAASSTAPVGECRIWRELAPELQTGDLVFFESRGIPSKTIRWYTKSQYSHLGMVVLPKDIDESDVGNVVLMVESHPNVRDRKDYRGEVVHGVQIGTVASKLELSSYKRIAVRKLVVNRTPEMMEILKHFLAETRNLPYTSNFVEVILAGGTGRFGVNESHLNSMHCTGLIAEIYIRWGLLPENIASNNYSPFDIEAMSLLRGYFTEDIQIYRSYNPLTHTIDLEPASIQTRYTISRALKAFQGGKQYKPGKALRLLTKQKNKQLVEDVNSRSSKGSSGSAANSSAAATTVSAHMNNINNDNNSNNNNDNNSTNSNSNNNNNNNEKRKVRGNDSSQIAFEFETTEEVMK